MGLLSLRIRILRIMVHVGFFSGKSTNYSQLMVSWTCAVLKSPRFGKKCLSHTWYSLVCSPLYFLVKYGPWCHVSEKSLGLLVSLKRWVTLRRLRMRVKKVQVFTISWQMLIGRRPTRAGILLSSLLQVTIYSTLKELILSGPLKASLLTNTWPLHLL